MSPEPLESARMNQNVIDKGLAFLTFGCIHLCRIQGEGTLDTGFQTLPTASAEPTDKKTALSGQPWLKTTGCP